MKVFATKYLEPMKMQEVVPLEGWSWTPESKNAVRIYASGANTQSRESTYSAERDNRADTDRPNEGMQIA